MFICCLLYCLKKEKMKEFSEEESKFFVNDEMQRYVEDRVISSGPRRSVHLWEFLLELLMDETYVSMIQWTDEMNGEFKLKSSEDVARKWGQRKHKEGMNYDKLSRALRYYYSKNIIKKVSGRRFVYKFVPSPEMHAAVNAIKTHLVRKGKKHVPPGPFPHYQVQMESMLPTSQDTKPLFFYPIVKAESASPNSAYSKPQPVIKSCHSPVRSRSPHRYPEREEKYVEDKHIILSSSYHHHQELSRKAKIFQLEEARRLGRTDHFRRRHHSEIERRHDDRHIDYYRLTPPGDHYRRHGSHSDDIYPFLHKHHELNGSRYHDALPPYERRYQDGNENSQEREDDVFAKAKEAPANDRLTAFIALGSMRHHDLSREIKQESCENRPGYCRDCPSPHQCSPRDFNKIKTSPYYGQPIGQAKYDDYISHPRVASLPPKAYMYQRFSPMVDVSTQTSCEVEDKTSSNSIETSREQDASRSWMYLNGRSPLSDIDVGEMHKSASSPAFLITSEQSRVSPKVINGNDVRRISPPRPTNNAELHDSTPPRCTCGCMDQIAENATTPSSNGTVVVYPKEIL